jgi:hypothetical protein
MHTLARQLIAIPLVFAALAVAAEISVFDKPSQSLRHRQLLARMDAAHKEGDYEAMAEASRKGVSLGTSDALWQYNLACALALLGQRQPALEALEQAVAGGFCDAAFARQDPDLAPLRAEPAWARLLESMEQASATQAAPARLAPAKPDAEMSVLQSATNTAWSFELGLFQSSVALPRRPAAAGAGAVSNALQRWVADQTASGFSGLLYANRDNTPGTLDVGRFPGLVRVAYSAEMTARRLHIGLPNTLFTDESGSLLIPVIGHSSMGYLNSPYWRCQPRAVTGDPRQLALQSLLLLGNQLFFYPAFSDYDPQAGDLFPANAPYWFAVAGGSGSEQPFVEAAFAALAALRPEVRAELTRKGLLMPALQMLLRASQRTLGSPRDYLTGLAHPAAFLPASLDTDKLVAHAHNLTTNDLPPVVSLAVLRESQAAPERDFFDAVKTERLYDTPFAIARVFRGAARTRTLEVAAHCKRRDARIHWVVLHGDPAKVAFSPCPTNPAAISVTVAHHPPYSTPVGGGKSIPTSRVDIGVIAEAGSVFSMPSIISFYMLGNELRVYRPDGRIASIDYTRGSGRYVDPLLSYTRNWKDVYRYDAGGELTGWTRRRGLDEEAFTAYGHKVVATDALGRATKAHVVRYVPRHVKADDGSAGLPDLAQMDDNIEVRYSYASDSDFVGAPDLATLTQEVAPPDAGP